MLGDYTTRTTVKLELKITDANDDVRIDRIITAASRAIDNWCQVPPRFFAGRSEVRVYDVASTLSGPIRRSNMLGIEGDSIWNSILYPADNIYGLVSSDSQIVTIDPMLAIPSEVAIDSNGDGTYASTMAYLVDYDLWPVNALVDSQQFLALRSLPATATVAFVVGQRALRIKSIWGTEGLNGTVQTLSITGSPTAGTFTVAYGGVTSVAIAYNATAAVVGAALAGMSSLARLTGNYPGTTAVTVSDGQLPSDTLTIDFPGLITGLTIGTNSLTGGTTPAPVLSAASYTGPSYPADLEQACILVCAKWLMEPRSAPMGMLGSPDIGMVKVGPQGTVLEILMDGGYYSPWIAV